MTCTCIIKHVLEIHLYQYLCYGRTYRVSKDCI